MGVCVCVFARARLIAHNVYIHARGIDIEFVCMGFEKGRKRKREGEEKPTYVSRKTKGRIL